PAQQPAEPAKVREKSFTAANDLKVTVRVTKPQDLDCDLQVMGYFKHKPDGDTVIEAIVDFDRLMGWPIKSLRDRGAFAGDELETIDFTPPKGSITPKRILLVGYGDEGKFTLDVLGRVGTATAREAVRLGAKKVAFAPALFDQGYKKLKARDVA